MNRLMELIPSISPLFEQWSDTNLRILRLVVGVSLSTLFVAVSDLTVAFITTVLVVKLLGAPTSCPSFKEGFMFVVVIAAGLVFGLLLTLLLLPYPLAFLTALSLAILHTFYLGTKGVSPMVTMMLLVGLLVIPMVSFSSYEIALSFIQLFIVASIAAVILVWLSYSLIPDNGPAKAKQKGEKSAGDIESAINSTLVVMPLVTVIFYLNMSGMVLVLVFVALLAQTPELSHGMKASVALLIGNGIGGLITMMVFELLVMVPSLVFYLLVMALLTLLVAPKVFTTGPKSIIWSTALTTVIILLGTLLSDSGGEADPAAYVRLIQFFLVSLYVMLSFTVITAWRERKRVKRDAQCIS